MNNPSIGIVIVNYNGAKFQNDCISSILESNYYNYKIIIVDNNSSDDSMKLLDQFQDGRIIKIYEKENWGVAKGNNIGIKKSMELGLDYTLLLNNDTVVEPNFIINALSLFNKYDVVASKIYFYNSNNIWYAGGKFIDKRCINEHINYGVKDVNIIYDESYEFAPTCCLFVKNNVFNKIGLIDENYFLYFDDTDFCMRLKLNGIKIGFANTSIIYHKVSQSTGGGQSKIYCYYANRNRMYYRKKFSKIFTVRARIYIWLSMRVKYIIGVIKNDNNKYIKKAIVDYKNGTMGRCDTL